MSDMQETVRMVASPRLAPFVGSMTGWAFSGLAPGTHQGLPSGNLTFIISLDQPIGLATMPGAQSPSSFDALVGGLHLKPATIEHAGYGSGMSVELSPLGAHRILGVPAASLASLVVDLADVIGPSSGRLVERLRLATGWDQRFANLEQALVNAVDASATTTHTPGPEVTRAWDRLTGSDGRIRIDELAGEIGWSRRTLSAQFRAALGVSPKAAARVLRFQRACALIDRGLPLASVAATAGYYDQAHMTVDWRRFSGTTPADWKLDELRDRTRLRSDDDARWAD